jgi:nicotinamide-nucleotide amidase
MANKPHHRLVWHLVRALDGRSVATAESCSGGRLGAALTAVDGAQDWYRGGVIAYQPSVERTLLGIRAPSVLSELAVTEMALGVADLLRAEVAMATSGVAGPSSQEGSSPGTVFVATVVDEDVRATTHHLRGDRAAVSDGAARLALRQVLGHLRDRVPPRAAAHGVERGGALR